MISILPTRETDNYGSGAYEASRGDRKHRGIDLACYPGTIILSPVSGFVTKIGYPYSDDFKFRYVQVTCSRGFDYRIMYIDPSVVMGQRVIVNESIIGSAQSLLKRYPNGMTNHIHFEIRRHNIYYNPEKVL